MNVAFVAPYLPPTTERFARAMAKLDGVRFGLITQEPLERVPETLRGLLRGHWQVDNALDTAQLVTAARGLAGQLAGPDQRASLDQLQSVLEHLQVAVARARQVLGLPGLDVEAAQLFRDKAAMKDRLRQAGVPCARHALATSAAEALARADAVGFPMVVKPPAGAGATGTYRVEDRAALQELLGFVRPNVGSPLLLEEFVRGEEHSFDSVFIDGAPVWHSLTHYAPTPLEVLRNPWIQWCVLLPREVDDQRYDDIRQQAYRAVSVLGMHTGFSHLEWFRRPDGSLAISEVAARPPGAQITHLISYAHDLDFYSMWARLMVYGQFDIPERRYAAGAAYLRGQGRGRVVAVEGLEEAQRLVGDLVIETRLPQVGQPAASSYEGDGYVIVRHPETATVTAALRAIVSTVRVRLEEAT